MTHIAIINGHMLGTDAEPGEHVDWNEPDVHTEAEWLEILGVDVVTYSGSSPHMIVWVLGDDVADEDAITKFGVAGYGIAAQPSDFRDGYFDIWLINEDPGLKLEHLLEFPGTANEVRRLVELIDLAKLAEDFEAQFDDDGNRITPAGRPVYRFANGHDGHDG